MTWLLLHASSVFNRTRNIRSYVWKSCKANTDSPLADNIDILNSFPIRTESKSHVLVVTKSISMFLKKTFLWNFPVSFLYFQHLVKKSCDLPIIVCKQTISAQGSEERFILLETVLLCLASCRKCHSVEIRRQLYHLAMRNSAKVVFQAKQWWTLPISWRRLSGCDFVENKSQVNIFLLVLRFLL